MELLAGMGEAEAAVALHWPCGCVSVGHIAHTEGRGRVSFPFKLLSPLGLVRRPEPNLETRGGYLWEAWEQTVLAKVTCRVNTAIEYKGFRVN